MSDAWAAPGSVPDPSPPTPTRFAVPLLPPAAGGRDEQRLPAPFRPLTLVEVLDGGITAIRRAPVPVLGAAAAAVVPYALVTSWLMRGVYEDTFVAGSSPFATAGTDSDAATLVAWVLGPLAHVLAAGPVARIVAGWYGGVETGLADALRFLVRRGWVLLALWFLVKALEGAGFLALGVGSVVAMTFCLVAVPAAAAEDLGPLAALRRSFSLTARRWFPSLWFAVLSGVVAGLFGTALSLLPQGIAFVVGAEALWVVVALAQMVATTLSTAFVAAATTLWYLDLRVRSEGLDLSSALDANGAG
jgi:hypothetical protein